MPKVNSAAEGPAMAAAILKGHVTKGTREEGHVTSVTNEQRDPNRGRNVKGETNGLYELIGQKYEIEIHL